MAATISCVPVLPVGLEGSQLLVTSVGSGCCLLIRAPPAAISSSSSTLSTTTSSSSSSTTFVTISPSVTAATSTSSSSTSSSTSKTVAQQMQALRPLRKQIQPLTGEEPPALRCKRRVDLSKLGYSLPKPQPGAVARRNERERNRVKQVNRGFDTLRQHVPAGRKNKKMSKVETLRCAVDYIRELVTLLQEDGVEPTPFPAPSSPLSPQDSLGSCPSPSTHCSSPSDGSLSPEGSYDSSGESFPSPTSIVTSPEHWDSPPDHTEGEPGFQENRMTAVFGPIPAFPKAEMDNLGSALAALHPSLNDALDESFDDLDSSDSSMKDEAESIESLSPTLHELRPVGEAFGDGFGPLDAFSCLSAAPTIPLATLQDELKAFTSVSSSSSSTSPEASMIFSSAPAAPATFLSLPDLQTQMEPQFLKQEEAPSCAASVTCQDSAQPHHSPLPLPSSSNGSVALETMQAVSSSLLSGGPGEVPQQEKSDAMAGSLVMQDLSRLVQENSSHSSSLAAMIADSLPPQLAEMIPSNAQSYMDCCSSATPCQTLTFPEEVQDVTMMQEDDVLAFTSWVTELCSRMSESFSPDGQRLDNLELIRDR